MGITNAQEGMRIHVIRLRSRRSDSRSGVMWRGFPIGIRFDLTPVREFDLFRAMSDKLNLSMVSIPSAAVLGRHIRAARLRKGLTQRELARSLYCSQRWVTEVENGKDTAQIGKLLALCQYLDLQVQLTFASKGGGNPDRRTQIADNRDDDYPSLDTIMGGNA